MTAVRGRVTGLVLAGLGVAAGVAALGIGEGLDAASWGPRTVPLIAAAALIAAGLADAASAGTDASNTSTGTAPEVDSRSGHVAPGSGRSAVPASSFGVMSAVSSKAVSDVGTPPLADSDFAESGASAVPSSDDRRLPWALLALAVLYVLLMGRAGYLVSTALTAPAAFALFGLRRPAALLAAALLCPTVLHVAFFVFLGVFPPRGAWFDTLGWLPP